MLAPTREASSPRVLVVDDDPKLLEVFGRILEAAGYKVECAISANAAQAAIDSAPLDAIVADIVMPAMSGIDLLRAVRKQGLDVPVILVTGQPHLTSAVEAVEYGAFRYLAKPVDPEALVGVVRHATQVWRLARLRKKAGELLGDDGQWPENRAELEASFGQALDLLWIAFQPIVSSKERSVFGFEALVRSSEPKLGNPADLFSAAGRLGRLHELGRIIRARTAACVELAPEGTQLFINVHPEDLNDFELYAPDAPLTRIARRTVLEITERSSLAEVSGLRPRLAKLRSLGFRIAVDDLGSGYAALSSFTQIEPDVVKLDMSLIRDIDSSSRKRSVVRSMLELASKDLNMLVVCEGVETHAEREVLVRLGADLLQGYLFARPSRDFASPDLSTI